MGSNVANRELNDIRKFSSPIQGSSRVDASPGSTNDDVSSISRTALFPTVSSRRIRWQKGGLIGAGSFGKVFLGLNADTGELLAVKQFDISPCVESDGAGPGYREQVFRELEAEIAVLSSLSHPNIVRYLGVEREGDVVNVFLEYVPGGSIHSLLKRFHKFDESVVRLYTRQMLEGLAFLHAHEIVHRDIKGANILVDTWATAKLADFGSAKRMGPSSADSAALGGSNNSLHGTPFWMSPEIIRGSSPTFSSDIWAVGCTVIEMLTGRLPWNEFCDEFFEEGGERGVRVKESKHHVAVMFRIADANRAPAFPSGISQSCRDFLSLCLDVDPKARPTAKVLLEHEFIASANVGGVSRPRCVSDASLLSIPSIQAAGMMIPTSITSSVSFENVSTSGGDGDCGRQRSFSGSRHSRHSRHNRDRDGHHGHRSHHHRSHHHHSHRSQNGSDSGDHQPDSGKSSTTHVASRGSSNISLDLSSTPDLGKESSSGSSSHQRRDKDSPWGTPWVPSEIRSPQSTSDSSLSTPRMDRGARFVPTTVTAMHNRRISDADEVSSRYVNGMQKEDMIGFLRNRTKDTVSNLLTEDMKERWGEGQFVHFVLGKGTLSRPSPQNLLNPTTTSSSSSLSSSSSIARLQPSPRLLSEPVGRRTHRRYASHDSFHSVVPLQFSVDINPRDHSRSFHSAGPQTPSSSASSSASSSSSGHVRRGSKELESIRDMMKSLDCS